MIHSDLNDSETNQLYLNPHDTVTSSGEYTSVDQLIPAFVNLIDEWAVYEKFPEYGDAVTTNLHFLDLLLANIKLHDQIFPGTVKEDLMEATVMEQTFRAHSDIATTPRRLARGVGPLVSFVLKSGGRPSLETPDRSYCFGLLLEAIVLVEEVKYRRGDLLGIDGKIRLRDSIREIHDKKGNLKKLSVSAKALYTIMKSTGINEEFILNTLDEIGPANLFF